MNEKIPFGEGYMDTYSTIPDRPLAEIPEYQGQDLDYLAGKLLGGHRRQFDPSNSSQERQWYYQKYETLCLAYGQTAVNKFFRTELKIRPPEV